MTAIWKIAGVFLVTILVIASTLLYAFKSPLPSEVRKQALSSILVPKGSDYQIDSTSAKIESHAGVKVLNYTVKIFGTSAVVGEQPTPEQFIEIPKAYDKVVSDSKVYKSFGSTLGNVSLTKPKDRQLAMLITGGTFMLVQPDKDLNEDQWRRFFNSLEIIK